MTTTLLIRGLFFIIFFSTVSSNTSFSQLQDTSTKKFTHDSLSDNSNSHPFNVIHVELLGNGGILSINYDRYLTQSFSIRAGIGALPTEAPVDGEASFHSTTGILLMANYLLWHYIEFGVGIDFLLHSKERCNISIFDNSPNYSLPDFCSSTFLTGRVGIRVLPHHKGFTFALALTPYFNFKPLAARFWFGISVGHSF